MEFLPHLSGLFVIYSVFFLQNASPGVNVMAVMGTSMGVGRGAGLALGCGVALGTLTWSTASVVGLSAVITSYNNALFYIKIAGGAYLFWLAYKSLKTAFARTQPNLEQLSNINLSKVQFLWRGYLINMTNPKAALGWVAIVSLGLQADSPWWVGFSIVVGTTCISLSVHVVYALLFSTQKMISAYDKARRPIQGALGFFFAYAGFRLITAKI